MTGMKRRFSGRSSLSPASTTASASSAYKYHSDEQNSPTGRRYRHEVATGAAAPLATDSAVVVDDRPNYALLLVLYTLQGIPMGLSASIPFLIQQKIQALAVAARSSSQVVRTAAEVATDIANASQNAAATQAAAVSAAPQLLRPDYAQTMSYRANAIFALCSWPFSLKLLWAPVVDACYFSAAGRRKSWLIPMQAAAGLVMTLGGNFVERQLGSGSLPSTTPSSRIDDVSTLANEAPAFSVVGVTGFFFVLYFLFATQDIAVDGWALALLSKPNRGNGPICNSIGQNIGYFLSFVGFLALYDIETCERWWRPLLQLPSNPLRGMITLGGFVRCMGVCMLVTTVAVALFKREGGRKATVAKSWHNAGSNSNGETAAAAVPGTIAYNELLQADSQPTRPSSEELVDDELDASQIGLAETYRRLWAVCQLPAVRSLFLVLLTYRLPTALSDNCKALKMVELGLSKSTIAALSPTVILPLGILVPLVAARVWPAAPLDQFLTAYKLRLTLVPLLDLLLLHTLRTRVHGPAIWLLLVLSTAAQTIMSSLQFNAQMTFFARRVDPLIGGSYMTLLNTAANLGGTWPASFILWLLGKCAHSNIGGKIDPYFAVQAGLSIVGCLWIAGMERRVRTLANLPESAWRISDVANADFDHCDIEAPVVGVAFLRASKLE